MKTPNILIIIILGIALMIATGLFSYYVTHVKRLDFKTVDTYISGETKYRDGILTSILVNSGQWKDWYSKGRKKNIEYSLNLRLERVKSKQKDLIIIIKSESGINLLAHYEKRDGYYEYMRLIDTFQDLRDVQIMPLNANEIGMLLVREHKRALPKTSEESVYICAYVWEDNEFKKVLNLLENYRAYYNELWAENKPKENCKWIYVAESTDIIWEASNAPVIHALTKQLYALGVDYNQKEQPSLQNFEPIRSRNVLEEYRWSDKWMHFILFEGTDILNAESVAILEDLSDGPFGLIRQFDNVNKKYRIKYIDGSIALVDKDRIRPKIKIKNTRVI